MLSSCLSEVSLNGMEMPGTNIVGLAVMVFCDNLEYRYRLNAHVKEAITIPDKNDMYLVDIICWRKINDS